MTIDDWRKDFGILVAFKFEAAFAWRRITLDDGTKIFWKKYYRSRKYLYMRNADLPFRKEAYVESISEAEFLVRKLAGKIDNRNLEVRSQN